MFDYFYDFENEQYLFLPIPWKLLRDPQFIGLSMDAKVLYSIMLEKTSMSAKKGWLDELDRVYVLYPYEEIMADMNCSRDKAIESIRELNEAGLIKSVQQGSDKPDIIYVMSIKRAS